MENSHEKANREGNQRKFYLKVATQRLAVHGYARHLVVTLTPMEEIVILPMGLTNEFFTYIYLVRFVIKAPVLHNLQKSNQSKLATVTKLWEAITRRPLCSRDNWKGKNMTGTRQMTCQRGSGSFYASGTFVKYLNYLMLADRYNIVFQIAFDLFLTLMYKD